MADETPTQSITTSEALGKFYRALVAEGVPEDTVSEIVIGAASFLLREEGLLVKASA